MLIGRVMRPVPRRQRSGRRTARPGRRRGWRRRPRASARGRRASWGATPMAEATWAGRGEARGQAGEDKMRSTQVPTGESFSKKIFPVPAQSIQKIHIFWQKKNGFVGWSVGGGEGSDFWHPLAISIHPKSQKCVFFNNHFHYLLQIIFSPV